MLKGQVDNNRKLLKISQTVASRRVPIEDIRKQLKTQSAPYEERKQRYRPTR